MERGKRQVGTLTGQEAPEFGASTRVGALEACRSRPFVLAALAVLAGAAVGGWLEGAAGQVTLDSGVAWAGLVRIAFPAFAFGVWMRAFALRSPHELRRPLDGPKPTWPALLLLACFAAALASRPRAASVRWDEHGQAHLEGAWRPLRATGRGVLGRIEQPGRVQAWVELPPGCASAGEWLDIAPIDAPRREARGPVPPPRAPGETEAFVLWSARSDEVQRRTSAPLWDAGTAWIARVRAGVERRCEQFEAGRPRALARALLYGDTASLDPELAATFARTGQRHVLAVSGMHVSLLAAVLLAPLVGRTGRRGRVALTLATAAALALFAGLTGGNAPVRRAAIALALGLAAPLWSGKHGPPRRPDTLSLLALSLLAEAALDVRALFSVSLLLSYSATLGLVLLTRPIARRLAGPRRRIALGPTGARHALRTLAGRWIRGTFAASFAAVIATLPLSWSLFGEWSPVGALVTALTTPLVAWLLVVGWLAVLVPPLVPAAAFDLAAHAYERWLEASDLAPGTPCVLPPRPDWLLAAATLLCVVGCLRGGLRDSVARLGCALAALLLAPWSVRPSGWVLDVLDVGHGTCAVLRGPAGPVWVYDAGSRDRSRVGPSALGPLLAQAEVGDVAVVLSHVDSDHAEALPWLADRYRAAPWFGAATAQSGERKPHTLGRVDAGGTGSVLDFELPGAGNWRLVRGDRDESNEGSRTLVAQLGAGEGAPRVALHGDAVEGGLWRQLELGALRGPVRVLLWPHHGDASVWSAELVESSRPEEVWVSGSARPEIARELERRGIPWRWTGRDGPLRRVFPALDPAPGSSDGHGSRSP